MFAIVAIAGCASSTVKERQEYRGEKIARPGNIIVYNFAASPSDIPTESSLANQKLNQGSSQTSEQVAAGRRVGAQIASSLVSEIRSMGLPAQLGSAQTQPQVGDLVFRGYLLSVDEGSAAKRVSIGFGSGAAQLTVLVEDHLMTERGLRKLSSGTMDSSGNKTPGAALGAVGLLASGSPAGLIVGTGMKVYGETTGSRRQGRGYGQGNRQDYAGKVQRTGLDLIWQVR